MSNNELISSFIRTLERQLQNDEISAIAAESLLSDMGVLVQWDENPNITNYSWVGGSLVTDCSENNS
jgi:hypothetical protein